MKIISFDPSGQGTTGVCIVENNNDFRFLEYKGKDWIEQVHYVTDLIKVEKPNLILYETSNWVISFGIKSLGVFKTFGGFEAVGHLLGIKVESVTVHQVKAVKECVLDNQISFANLTYEAGRGKGWMFNGERLSLHKLDAFFIYSIWTDKELFSRASKIIYVKRQQKKLTENNEASE